MKGRTVTVEVKELTINATVIQSAETSVDQRKIKEKLELNQAEVISACVEQVLKILENSKER